MNLVFGALVFLFVILFKTSYGRYQVALYGDKTGSGWSVAQRLHRLTFWLGIVVIAVWIVVGVT